MARSSSIGALLVAFVALAGTAAAWNDYPPPLSFPYARCYDSPRRGDHYVVDAWKVGDSGFCWKIGYRKTSPISADLANDVCSGRALYKFSVDANKQCAGAPVSATLNGKAIAGVVVDQPPGAKDQDAWTLRSPGLDVPAMTEADTVELCINIEHGGYHCSTIEDLFPRKNYKLALWGKDVVTNVEHDCCPVFTGFPSEKTTCDVCFEWTLEGCKDNYYHGDVCDQALGQLESMLNDMDAKDFVGDHGCHDNKIWVCGSFESVKQGKYFYNSFSKAFKSSQDAAIVAVIEDDFCDAFPGSTITVKSYDWTGKHDHNWDYSQGWQPNKCEGCDIDISYTCEPEHKPAPKPYWNKPTYGDKPSYKPEYKPEYKPTSKPTYNPTPTSKPTYNPTPTSKPTYGPKPWRKPAPAPVSGPTCDVCYEWTLSGCDSNYYGEEDSCDAALHKVAELFGECGYEDFGLEMDCHGSSIYVCGSFPTVDDGHKFYDDFTSRYSQQDVALSVVDAEDFCAAFPGAVVTVKSYDFTQKYDHTWSYDNGWEPASCDACSIDITFECEEPSYTPSSKPSYNGKPTSKPSYNDKPTSKPSYNDKPSSKPSYNDKPTSKPTYNDKPSSKPSYNERPSSRPSYNEHPTSKPTYNERPTSKPSYNDTPTSKPSYNDNPTSKPTYNERPTSKPTYNERPSSRPSYNEHPTSKPTYNERPTSKPSYTPSYTPSYKPAPWARPTSTPTYNDRPSSKPTYTPTYKPAPWAKPSYHEEPTTCDVCFEWTLSGCSEDYYGNGDACYAAKEKVKYLIGECGYKDFGIEMDCRGNSIFVCGSFPSEADGYKFRDELNSHYSNDLVALAVVDEEEFCAAFPGAVVSVKSYNYPGKYDHNWDSSYGWEPAQCTACNIDITFECEPGYKPAPQVWHKPASRPSYYEQPTSKPSYYERPTSKPTYNEHPSSKPSYYEQPTSKPTYNDRPTSRPSYNEHPTSKPTYYERPSYWERPTSKPDWYRPSYTPSYKPSSKETCDVCWSWTLSDCKDSYYYKGDICDKATYQILSVITKINDMVHYVVDGFDIDNTACEDNTVYVCGSFESSWAGKEFVELFRDALLSDDQCKVGVVGDFCKANPGATISLKTHDWTSKYDHDWSYSSGWQASKCEGCDLEAELTCPTGGWGWGGWKKWFL